MIRHRQIALALAIMGMTAGPILVARLQVENPPAQPRYEVRAMHDPNGTGRFYLGREIAQVMGPGGLGWLDRPEREDQETSQIGHRRHGPSWWGGSCGFGAGSGYFTFRLAARVGGTGKVLAVEIQDEMLAALRRRSTELGVTNVEEIKGSETDPQLPAGGVDLVLMVDVYHELAYPFEVMTRVREALKPRGRVVFVEYRKEDPRDSHQGSPQNERGAAYERNECCGTRASRDGGIPAFTTHRDFQKRE